MSSRYLLGKIYRFFHATVLFISEMFTLLSPLSICCNRILGHGTMFQIFEEDYCSLYGNITYQLIAMLFLNFQPFSKQALVFSSTGRRSASYCHGVVFVMHLSVHPSVCP